MDTPEIIAAYQPAPIPCDLDFDALFWKPAQRLEFKYNWRGIPIPPELRTLAMITWNNTYLFAGFECAYEELDLDDAEAESFNPEKERYALWEQDVCEVFIRTHLNSDVRVYKEFEAAPNGQWCDLKIDWSERVRDWEWQSGLQVSQAIDYASKVYRLTMSIPFEALDAIPEKGTRWQVNLYRISRLKGERQYLAWSPTMTSNPSFHVPERFAALVFAK